MKQCAAALACVVAAVVTLAARAPQSSVGLALFDEVWSTVNESYYDPTFGGLSWVGVRDELRPKAAAARSEDDARAVVNEMLGRLKRSHFALLASSGGYDDEMVLKGEANFGVEARVAAGAVVVTHVVSRGV
jgi:carboxyl-terminal processing protease